MLRPCVWIVVAVALVAGGCGEGTGFLIKPVPVNEALKEITVPPEVGPFVADKIAVVGVDGLIMNARNDGMFGRGENPVSLFVEEIDKAQKDMDVKALVLRINSPGGGVTATDLMYRRLAEFKKERKVPVGSIGVIVQTFSLAGTLAKLGIDAKAVTSGPRKDMASPFKPLDPEDEKILQGIVTEFYGRFLEIVAAGRPALGKDGVKALADGRVYTGTQAVANHLADAAGDMSDALAEAKKRAGVKTARIVMYDRPWGYKGNVYSAAPVGGMQINLLNVSAPNLMTWLEPQFLYLWTGAGGGAANP
jgi:protease-4